MNRELKTLIKRHHQKKFAPKKFIWGKTSVPVSGKVFDHQELVNGVDAVLDGWWTEGRFAKKFEQNFGKLLGVRFVSLVNSGSSANLTAFSSLTSHSLKNRAIKPGDEVITVACGFPTTINPIIQNNCIPVFVDSDPKTKNANISMLEKAISKKTKAIMMAHTLGNPFNLSAVTELAKKHNLWLIEDCCDALGSEYDGKYVGTFGDIATFSFYPAHQITFGEGGAVITNNPFVHRAIRQYRDWGRDCWCDTGKDNTCRKRFGWQLGDLPMGYDHKYIYSHIGYNLKLTDLQASIGVAQLKKLPKFIKARRDNFNYYKKHLAKHSEYLSFSEHEKEASPCWFGFMITVTNDAPFTRNDIVQNLEKHNIATRNLFAGNLLYHPAYQKIRHRVVGSLDVADNIMNNGFWIGVYPGISKEMRSYVVSVIDEFINNTKATGR